MTTTDDEQAELPARVDAFCRVLAKIITRILDEKQTVDSEAGGTTEDAEKPRQEDGDEQEII